MAETVNRGPDIDLKPYIEKGFDRMQCEQIRRGIRDKVDVSVYTDLKFDALQMREMRRGMKAGLDVSLYARHDLNAYQMREVRVGIEKGIDMTAFVNPEYPPLTIRALAVGKENDIDAMYAINNGFAEKKALLYVQGKMADVDIMPYLKRGLAEDQIEAVIEAGKKNIDLTPYLGLNLYGVQLSEITLALEKGLNVSSFANGGYNWIQMHEIVRQLEKGIDIKPILNRDFSVEQMREICMGIEKGLDVTRFAKPGYEPDEMAEIREEMFKEGDFENRIDEILSNALVSDLLTMDDLPQIDFDIGSEAQKLLEQEEVVNPAVELAKELIGNTVEEIEKTEEVETELKRDIHIVVAEDRMSATLNITQPSNDTRIGVREITKALREYDIKQGIKQDVIKKVVDEQLYFMDIVVAEGKLPIKGEDGRFDFHFRKEVKATPKILPNGAVDYKGIELFETVEKGQVIADYIPATGGEFGYDIEGNLINPERGHELPTLKGKGFHASEDKKQYISDITGIIEWIDDETIEIRNVYVVDGDVDLSVGNVNFDGDVEIRGNVDADFMISASGNVSIAGNCEACSIFAGKDILIQGGVQGRGISEINAGGSLIGQFFESCKAIKAGEDVTCTYLLNCDTYCEGKLSVAGRRGVIIGGHTIAKMGMECFGIGNLAESKSIVEVGVGEGDTKAYTELMNKCEKVQNDIKTLENGIEKIMAMEKRDPKVDELYDKLTDALYTQKQELKELLEEREISIVKMSARKDAEIEVKGTVYPGTRVIISSDLYMVKETIKNVRFVKQDGVVGYVVRTKL